MYSCYTLTDEARAMVMELFPPKYEKVIAHHVTETFGCSSDEEILPAEIKIIGYVDNEDGLEALKVSVNGKFLRQNGMPYHITLSLDPTKHKPVDSNDLVMNKNHTLTLQRALETIPQILG